MESKRFFVSAADNSAMTDKKYDKTFSLSYLKPVYFKYWLGILLLGFLAFVPAVLRDALATALSSLGSRMDLSIKHKGFSNLNLAFPEWDEARKEQVYRDFLRVGLKVILGYGVCFFRSGRYISKTFAVTGREYLDEARALDKPIIFLGSHSWAIDHCGLYLPVAGLPMTTFMHTSENPLYDWFMNSMRLKFGGKVYERSAGIKPLIRSLKEGYHTIFYGDEDLGEKSAVFVKFFAHDKATLITLSKMAKLSGAIVVPMFSAYNEKLHKFEAVFEHYFEVYPEDCAEKDARRMNESIERALKGREGQYMWNLRCYKTAIAREAARQEQAEAEKLAKAAAAQRAKAEAEKKAKAEAEKRAKAASAPKPENAKPAPVPAKESAKPAPAKENAAPSAAPQNQGQK